jgi:hypothetical protein
VKLLQVLDRHPHLLDEVRAGRQLCVRAPESAAQRRPTRGHSKPSPRGAARQAPGAHWSIR